MFLEKSKFKNSKGLTLSAIFEGENKNAPVVVMCHGFASSKDSESNQLQSQKLLELGLSVFKFDFTGCGESEGTIDQLTPLQGLDDLNAAVQNLKVKNFSLVGSSFGGYVALLYASKNPVKILCLRAPVSDYPEVETIKSVENYGFTKEKKKNFLREIKDINIYRLAKNIKAPTLIVHGDADPIVPVKQSKKLYKILSCEKRLEILPGAVHVMRGTDLQKATAIIAKYISNKV